MQIWPHAAQTLMPVKNQWVKTLVIFVYSSMYVRYVRNHFSWSKNFPFGRKHLIFIRGVLTNGAKVANEHQNVIKKNFFFQTAISRELSG